MSDFIPSDQLTNEQNIRALALDFAQTTLADFELVEVPMLHAWAAFYEDFLLNGGEATQEYRTSTPAEVTTLKVVK
jgi:hypothetical protein